MPELLLEVGTEELPATFVRKAYTDLLELVGESLRTNGLWAGEGCALGTPRRLIVSFPEVKDRQEDSTKEQRGPALKAAYDAEGNPTPALLGFCRSQGVDPKDLRKDEQYVWVTRQIPGRSAQEILSEVLPEAIRKLSFEKSMRWGSSRMRFARPLRWILAALDGKVVPFEIEGVVAGVQSRGHRFYSPDAFEAKTYQALVSELRQRFVEPDPQRRREKLVEEAIAVANGTPDLPEGLVEENTFLTEWPTAIAGEFKTEFRALPDPVLVTAMAKHERMFPVRDAEGNLTNGFVFIRNSGEDSTVRQGAEWVLNARFNDAKFFFIEDQKMNLQGFLEKTSGIIFQEKLGTVRQRADRLATLASQVAVATDGTPQEIAEARLAGLYSKADLATGLVSELASLQGVIGGEYARREGLPENVCVAIAAQYDPSKADLAEPAAKRTALRLALADQIDKLAGYLGLGLVPSGSSDPFGLRRAATILIDSAWGWPTALPSYRHLLKVATELYEQQGVQLDDNAAMRAMDEIFRGRYIALLPEIRHDILDASTSDHDGFVLSTPRRVRLRVAALNNLDADTAFVQTATRPLNIVSAARRKGVPFTEVDPLSTLASHNLDSTDGEALAVLLKEVEPEVRKAVEAEDVDRLVVAVRRLAGPINRFFDSTMVMADDEAARTARLDLMQAAALVFLEVGDFAKLVVE